MKNRYLAVFALIIMCMGIFSCKKDGLSVLVMDGGMTGSLSWILNVDGTLTISGNGEMPDYLFGGTFINPPWYSYADAVKRVVIEEGVTSIGDYAFRFCNKLISIDIPDRVTNIGDYAFSRCIGLTTINIPEGMRSIEYSAFYECSHLSSVTISAGITNIAAFAFAGCSNLVNVTILATTPPTTLYGTNFLAENDTLYVPVGCVDAYKAIPEWRNAFATITEIQ